ncbi:MAG: class I SAM-dependent methyltransferase [Acidimicrobiales bacterium]|nr:class I SAM-dependent methyltransferase [Acidimicrobiales bacterium]
MVTTQTTTGVMCVAEPGVAITDPSFQRNGIDVYVCPSCGSYVCDSGYEVEQYDDSYYTIASADLDEIEGRWGFRWRYVLDRIAADVDAGSTVLDVGAGNGYFVKLAAEEYGLAATGIEISEASAAFARDHLGVDLLVEDLAEHDETYDVVTAFSVLEHVEDPAAMLASLIARVRPGGLLVLATPNPACIQRRVKGEKRWSMICPPHHLNIFSRTGLERMVSAAGLEPLSWEAISTSVKSVRRIDTDGQLLRKAIFHTFRATRLGADQLLFARTPS